MDNNRQTHPGKLNISDYLSIGAENARRTKDLAQQLGIAPRMVTLIVERERREGQPICASSDAEHPGYYLAADKGEMQRFCNSLFHRAGEIHKTRKACLKTLDTLPESEAV